MCFHLIMKAMMLKKAHSSNMKEGKHYRIVEIAMQNCQDKIYLTKMRVINCEWLIIPQAVFPVSPTAGGSWSSMCFLPKLLHEGG